MLFESTFRPFRYGVSGGLSEPGVGHRRGSAAKPDRPALLVMGALQFAPVLLEELSPVLFNALSDGRVDFGLLPDPVLHVDLPSLAERHHFAAPGGRACHDRADALGGGPQRIVQQVRVARSGARLGMPEQRADN